MFSAPNGVLKTSLSFNNYNFYRYSNENLHPLQNNISLENTLNDFILKKMNNISFCSPIHNINANNNKERKVNFINVNNYFSPQINIIRVNKINESNKRTSKRNKNEKEDKINSKTRGKSSQKLEVKKVEFIQLWWKEIFKIIFIQKHIRGFIFRNKLLAFLEKEEKTLQNFFYLYKIIGKILFRYVLKQIKEYILNFKNIKTNNNNNLNLNNAIVLKEKNNKGIFNNINKNITINTYKSKKEKNFKKSYNDNNNNYNYIKIAKTNNNIKLRTLENISMKNYNNEFKRRINKNKNKKKGNILKDIRNLMSKKYSKMFTSSSERYNKSIINNLSTNETKLNNRDSCDFKIKEKQKKNPEKSQKKLITKSRNIESNNAFLSTNFIKNNKK